MVSNSSSSMPPTGPSGSYRRPPRDRRPPNIGPSTSSHTIAGAAARGASDTRRGPPGEASTSSTDDFGRAVNEKFYKAVDIIQSLPKSGPITTTYEEKLMLYSLYKQGEQTCAGLLICVRNPSC